MKNTWTVPPEIFTETPSKVLQKNQIKNSSGDSSQNIFLEIPSVTLSGRYLWIYSEISQRYPPDVFQKVFIRDSSMVSLRNFCWYSSKKSFKVTFWNYSIESFTHSSRGWYYYFTIVFLGFSWKTFYKFLCKFSRVSFRNSYRESSKNIFKGYLETLR